MLKFSSVQPIGDGLHSIAVTFNSKPCEVLLTEAVTPGNFDDYRPEILRLLCVKDWVYFYQEIRRIGVVDLIASKVISKPALQFAFSRLETALTATHVLRDVHRYWHELLPVVSAVLTEEQKAAITLAAQRSNLAELLDPSRPPYDPVIDGTLADYETKYPISAPTHADNP